MVVLVLVDVHAHLRSLSRADLALYPVGRLRDPTLGDARLESRHSAARLFNLGHHLASAALDLVGQPLEVVRTGERVRGARHPALEGDYLLGPQGERYRLLARQLVGLVIAHDMNRLGPSQDGAEALERRAHDIVKGLLCSECRAGVAREKAKPCRRGVRRPELLGGDRVPEPAGGAQLGHLLEQLQRCGEVKRQAWGEGVELEATADELLRVGDGVGHREA